MNARWRDRLLLGTPVLALVVAAASVLLESPSPDRVLNASLASVGLVLIWIAAALTALTGWEYFRKAMPHLREER